MQVPRTLVEMLRYRAESEPNWCAYSFLPEHSGQQESCLTHFDLDRRARAIAERLGALKAAGERVLLLYPAGLEFIAAFFGCMYAGAVAVPAYPLRRERDLLRLEALVTDAGAAFALTTAKNLEAIEPLLKSDTRLRSACWIASDGISNDSADRWLEPAVTPESIAFIQYTSGSTRTPCGVVLTHENVLTNAALIQRCFQTSLESKAVFWLPFYHDMGLIGGILQTLFCRATTTLMAPLTFLQSPFRWLETISKRKADISGGPNFAYELCMRSITPEQRATLDLSAWTLAFNGAEPVRAETMDRFAEMFAPCGFRREAFYPCYGLAEATLIVSGGTRGVTARRIRVDRQEIALHRSVTSHDGDGTQLVSSGRIAPDVDLRIVDPEYCELCEPVAIGEIWVRGATVSRGYWNKPETTKEVFGARLADTAEGPFLRTGDLGFLSDGELYVTGRIKDLIIIRGQNYYAHDIERSVEECESGARAGGCAALGVDDAGNERLVVVVEAKRRAVDTDAAGMGERIAAAVAQAHLVQVHRVVFVKPGGIPKTSSGKTRRAACRERMLAGELEVLGEWPIAKTHAKVSVPGSKDHSGQSAEDLVRWLREYAASRINSRLIDERRSIPPYIVLDLGNRGVLGMEVPRSYGGLELKTRDALRVVEQLAAIDLTLASFVGVNNVLGVRPILRSGSAAMREELLPLLARGRELAAFALTEPGAGSNPRAMAAIAVPDGRDGWWLQGTKSWIGSGSWAGVVNVFVRLGEGSRENEGITAFAVRRGSPGLRQGAESLTMGMRGMVQNAIHLEDVPVTRADLLGTVGDGFDVAQDAMLSGRLGIGAMSVGAMKRCAQLMVRYATRREVATGRLIDNPVTLVTMAHLAGATAAVDALVSRVAELMDEGRSVPTEAYVACKIAGPEFLWLAADALVQTLGGRGYIETNIAPQILRDARLLRVFEGPTEPLEMYLGASAGGEAVRRFLAEDLGSANVARELQAAVDEVMRRGEGDSGGFADPLARRRWATWQVGKVATCAVLWGALQWTGGRDHSEQNRRAAEWARRRFLEARARAMSESPDEAVLLDATGATQWVASYADAVGDVEQTLTGEDHELDPMLRRDPIAAAVRPGPPVTMLPIEKPAVELADGTTDQLQGFLAKAMRLPKERIDVSAPLHSLGLDSLVVVELKHHVEQRYGAVVSITEFLGNKTLAQLAKHLAQPKEKPRAAAVAQEAEDAGEFPLSIGQQALWLLHELDPEGSAYNVGVAFEIDGAIDVTAMEVAVHAVVQRHSMLRTTFHSHDGQPVQRVHAESKVRISIQDTRDLSEDESRLRASEEARRPFDLENGPLMRAVVFQRSSGRSVFLLVLHHIVEDSWSMGVVLYELSQCYRAARRSAPVNLPAVASTYREYVRQQQSELSTDEKGWAYWKAQLEGAPSAIDLPTDRPRPPVQGYRGATLEMRLDGDLFNAIKVLCKTERVTLFTSTLAAFQVLLHRYSRQDDICVGSTMAGRGRAEWSGVVGYFVNPVVLRARFGDKTTFRDLLRQTRETVQGAFENQEFPFPRLVERLRPQRDPSRSPLFQVMFTLQKELSQNLSLITGGRIAAGTQLDLDGASLRTVPLDGSFAQFDLSLMMTESSDGLAARFEYNTDLFEPTTIERMAGHFRTLLAAAVSAPEQSVGLLPMLTVTENRQLMEWAAASRSIPVGPAVQDAVDFSLFYFSCNESQLAGDKYRLLVEGARFADTAGFCAVWTPERHFHSFGGLYPNPSVLGSALAMITRNIRIRAGSVVLPLHNPLRVAEEWAVVDNLSAGRVDLAFAAGWNATDFVLAPGHHAGRKQILASSVETVRRLWRGKSVAAADGTGKDASVCVYPLPVQKELPVWITCVGSPESFVAAGSIGANVLTALLLQSVDELKDRIALYREARRQNGYDAGHVTLMLHTLVGEDAQEVHARIRRPFMEYLRSSVELWAHSAQKLEDLSDRERDDLLAYSFERYCRTAALFGTPECCAPMVGRLRDIGVNELACLIDFGVEANVVMSGLKSLDVLRRRFATTSRDADERDQATIHGLFEAQAGRTPDAIAVAFGKEQIAYRELDARANAIAAELRRLGIGPEKTVGLYLDRSAAMVTAVLAVLKAGGAYVPLDPAYPASRLEFMMSDASITVVLANRRLAANLPRGTAHVFLVEDEYPQAEPVISGVASDGLVYVMYTSGSTGRPRGVQVSHAAVVNFLRAMRGELAITAGDRLLAVTRLSFDIAGLELLLPLTVGATVEVASDAAVGDASQLIATLERSSITMMQATPATWRMLLEAGWKGTPGLKMLCGGEAMSRELAERLLPMGSRLWNLYGPTETTIWSAIDVVESGEGPIPIGRPIAQTQLHVLDANLQPLPIGLCGELYIGGVGLARGYLNQPELTARQFIPDPLSGVSGARLYRTGDMVRRLTDGRLEFLGRADQQVKIRGHRIELGEIEAALAAHPAVREAVVVVREDGTGDQRMVAYLLADLASFVGVGAMRAFLRERLPDYMLPGEYVTLDRWPLTSNGKIDRKALPRPQHVEHLLTAPRTQLETNIAAAWREVLRVPSVGVDQNFFDLGGHSLLLAQVHSRLRERLGLDVSMVDLFRYPTVGALASHVAGSTAGNGAFRAQVADRVRMRRARRAREMRMKPAEDKMSN